MAGFDLRDHLPFFLAMDFFDDLPHTPVVTEELLQEFIIKNFYEHSNEYKNALNDLIKTFNIKSYSEDVYLISIKLDKLLEHDVNKFIDAWKYMLLKYEHLIYTRPVMANELVNFFLFGISITLEDEDIMNHNKIFKMIETNTKVQNIIINNKFMDNRGLYSFLDYLLNKYEKTDFFVKMFNQAYNNRNKYVGYNFDFNAIIRYLISFATSTKKLDVLFNEFKNKNVASELYSLYDDQYKEHFKEEEIERREIEEEIKYKELQRIREEQRLEERRKFGEQMKKRAEERKRLEEERRREEIECGFQYVVIVGINYDNRREAFEKLKVDEKIFLVREPDNKFDKNAIKVINNSNEMLGYVVRNKANEIAPRLDNGEKCNSVVTEIEDDIFVIKVVWNKNKI